MQRLTRSEKRVLLAVPSLWPDCDSDDLVPRSAPNREAASYALQALMKFDLISASEHEGVHPLAPYYRNVELTAAGLDLQRDLSRLMIVRILDREWRWLVTTAIAVASYALSIRNALTLH